MKRHNIKNLFQRTLEYSQGLFRIFKDSQAQALFIKCKNDAKTGHFYIVQYQNALKCLIVRFMRDG